MSAKSMGEKLFDSTVAAMEVGDRWADCPPDGQAEMERVAIAFAASLSPDETATATITALEAEVWRLREANQCLVDDVECLREALTPLADCEVIEPDVPLLDSDRARYAFSMGEIRAARAALKTKDTDQ